MIAINLNETGYLVLFFLTEKIYEKIYLGKLRAPNFGKFNIQKLFSLSKNRKKPKVEVHCTQEVYWNNSALFLFFFHLPSITNELLVLAVLNTLKPIKSIHHYVAMATAESISIFFVHRLGQHV